MLGRLLEFVQLLRKNGVRVSPAEVLEGLRAAELVGLGDPGPLRDALRATLVKRGPDEETLDELFDLYFLRRGEFVGAGGDAPLADALRQRGFSDDELESLLAILADEAARLDPTARTSLGLRRSSVESLLRLSGVEVDLSRMVNPMQVGFFAQQVTAALKLREAEGEIERLRLRLERTLGPERAAALAEVLSQNVAALRQAVRRYVTDEFNRRNLHHREEWRQATLADKPFGQMTPEEIAQLRDEVERLARKLRAMATLRPKTERRGRLDARRTIRRSLRSGGVPFELKRRRRRIEKPRLVVLCDISDSVRHVSRFMLQFAYSLQDQFAKVRSFVFVSELAEVTELFSEHELGRAVELAYAGAAVNVYANSNYGRALTGFHERYLDAATPKTTVIVIGDGRNNYHPPEAWVLAELRERARRLLWLNPEPPLSWAFGDSAMRDYQPYCDRIAVVNNLTSLKEVIDSLIL